MDYDTWFKETPLEFKKKIVEHFVKNSINYANQHILFRSSELKSAPIEEIETRCSRILKWTSYVEFQNHTLHELPGTKLDEFLK